MSDYRFSLPDPQAEQQLQGLVEELRAAVEPVVAGAGQVIRRAPEVDADDFSQDLLVRSPLGELEIAVQWERASGEAGVSVLAASGSRSAYLPLVLAFGAALLADQTPELLPIFRGLRVMLGVLAGSLLGVMVLAIVSAFGAGRRRVDRAFEERVQGAVRRVLSSRALILPSA